MAPKHHVLCRREEYGWKTPGEKEECPCYLPARKNVGNEQQLLDKAVWEAALWKSQIPAETTSRKRKKKVCYESEVQKKNGEKGGDN